MNKMVKRMYYLLYCLRKKGVVCLSKEWIIFFPYNQDPNVLIVVPAIVVALVFGAINSCFTTNDDALSDDDEENLHTLPN